MRRSRAGPRASAASSGHRPRSAAIGVVLLAAGGSVPHGAAQASPSGPAAEASDDEEPLLRHAARAAVESAARPVVVVLGDVAESLTPQIADLPVHAVDHAGWVRGIGSSIKVGVECLTALAPSIDGVIISVCDQPHLSAAVFSRLGRAYRGSDAVIVASAYAGIAGVPALFDRSVFSELLALGDRDGAQALIARDPTAW